MDDCNSHHVGSIALRHYLHRRLVATLEQPPHRTWTLLRLIAQCRYLYSSSSERHHTCIYVYEENTRPRNQTSERRMLFGPHSRADRTTQNGCLKRPTAANNKYNSVKCRIKRSNPCLSTLIPPMLEMRKTGTSWPSGAPREPADERWAAGDSTGRAPKREKYVREE